MKSTKIAASLLVMSLALTAGAAHAWGLANVLPSASGGGGGSTANAGDVAKNARNALYSFVKSDLGLLAALGGYENLAANQKLLDGMKTGDAAASKEDTETLVTLHNSMNPVIEAKTKENMKLDANNKALAGKSMVEYVKGLVSSKQLLSSVQDLAKNPMALGTDASNILYVAKELPGIVSGGVSTTSTLFKYLGANGVDLSEAKNVAKGMGT
jgi:hypothetical protein